MQRKRKSRDVNESTEESRRGKGEEEEQRGSGKQGARGYRKGKDLSVRRRGEESRGRGKVERLMKS